MIAALLLPRKAFEDCFDRRKQAGSKRQSLVDSVQGSTAITASADREVVVPGSGR
jgi:hypothetical protein